MTLPFFFLENIDTTQPLLTLDEDTSKHVVSVLRMKNGSQLHLTDGKGNVLVAEITDDHKKRCVVKTVAVKHDPPSTQKISMAVSLLKNSNRFEWFLEKATELGITEIIPLICSRTEKQHFRYNRMKNILVSALLQSQQSRLPVLHQPIGFEQLLKQEDITRIEQKFIAHCMPGQKNNLNGMVTPGISSQIILIGPEGDFTPEEIEYALNNKYIPVKLGDTRLRTETAAVVAATLLKI